MILRFILSFIKWFTIFSMAVFILAIFLPENVSTALEIFKNLLKIP